MPERFRQAAKAMFPMEPTLLGTATTLSPVQPRKAPSPMEVTLEGMWTPVNPSQL